MPGFLDQLRNRGSSTSTPAPQQGATTSTMPGLQSSNYATGRGMVSPDGADPATANRPKSPLGQKVYDANAARISKMEPERTADQDGDTAAFEKNFESNKARYEDVSARTGIPARLIAAIHWRESGGNFGTYLHQGDPLGKPAVHVPTDIPVFDKWEDAAVNALQSKKSVQNDLGMKADTQDKAAMATYAEYYNGLGYQARGQPSPYVFAGTNQYKSGKYVADGKYDPKTVDRQMGVMGLIGADKADS